MSEPFFDLQHCPAFATAQQPPAIVPRNLITNCNVPVAPAPVFQCPPPNIGIPGIFGTQVIYIRITDRLGIKHSWTAVEPNGTGGWHDIGLSGTIADKKEAYTIGGWAVAPGPQIYAAYRDDATDKLFFRMNDSPRIKITGTPVAGAYGWKQVIYDQTNGWVDSDVTGSPESNTGAKEMQGLPAIPDDEKIYKIAQTEDGQFVFNTTDANSGFLVVPPSNGIAAGSTTICGAADCELVKLVGGNKSASGIFATVYNPYPVAVGQHASLARPLQVKIVSGHLIVDVDPCA